MKHKYKTLLGSVLYIIVWIVLIGGFAAIPWLLPGDIVTTIIFFVVAIIILFTDKCGLKNYIFGKLPFKRHLKNRKSRNNDFYIELYRTLSFYSLLIYWYVPEIRFITSALITLFPVLSLIRYFRNADRIQWGSDNKNDFTTLEEIFFWNGMLFIIWNIYNIQFNQKMILYVLILASIFIIPFFFFTKEYVKRFTIALGYIFLLSAFSFGIICNINQDYDFSEPEEYTVKIIDKHIEGGKAKTCKVIVSSWKSTGKTEELAVDNDTYKKAEKDKPAYIIVNNGLLGIEWYYLDFKN